MTRIEKTQVNVGAFIILCSTLEKIQSDKIIEIGNEGTSITLRHKAESEKEILTLDLSLLNELFKSMVSGDPAPLVVNGEAEKYLKNCSFACDFYRNENEKFGSFDHFDLFHKIHFKGILVDKLEEEIIKHFCGLFRIEFSLCSTFFSNRSIANETIKLPVKRAFNEIFQNLTISIKENERSLVFDSCHLTMKESLDALFTVKDLLSSYRIDVSQIPEYNWFSIPENDTITFKFLTLHDFRIKISFKYDQVVVEINKNCA
jgi:hypothetical protein